MDDPTAAARTVVERYANAWLAGDLVAVIDCYAEDFTLHYFGAHRFAGTHRGRDVALSVLAEVSTLAPRELLAVDGILAGPGTAALVVRERLRRDGEEHELTRVLRYRVDDDRLVECWLLDEDQALVDRLWS